MLDRLALLPWLTGVSLQSSVRATDLVNFTIGAIFVGDEACTVIDRLTPRTMILLTAPAILVVGLVGWFGFVAPERSEASALQVQIDAMQTRLEIAEKISLDPNKEERAVQLRQLEIAMPQETRVAMPQVLRQLSEAARKANVRIRGVTPSPAVARHGYQVVPISLTVDGRYFGIANFLELLRTQAILKDDSRRCLRASLRRGLRHLSEPARRAPRAVPPTWARRRLSTRTRTCRRRRRRGDADRNARHDRSGERDGRLMASIATRRKERVAASKKKRKTIFVVVGAIALVAVLVIQVPRTLDLLSSDATAVAPVAPAPATPTTPKPPARPARLLDGTRRRRIRSRRESWRAAIPRPARCPPRPVLATPS